MALLNIFNGNQLRHFILFLFFFPFIWREDVDRVLLVEPQSKRRPWVYYKIINFQRRLYWLGLIFGEIWRFLAQIGKSQAKNIYNSGIVGKKQKRTRTDTDLLRWDTSETRSTSYLNRLCTFFFPPPQTEYVHFNFLIHKCLNHRHFWGPSFGSFLFSRLTLLCVMTKFCCNMKLNDLNRCAK